MREFALSDVGFLILAAQWTILLSLISFVGGSIIGMVVALMRTSRLKTVRIVAASYIYIVQSTPLLMQLFLVFFGLSLAGFRLPALVAAAIATSVNSSAFLAEIWRGSIQSIPKTQWEAGESLAFTRLQQLRYIIVPQAIRIGMPPTVGFSIQIIKNTSLASIIGFIDVIRTAQNINNSTFQPLLVFSVVGCIYFLLCLPLTMWSKRLEEKLNVGR